MTRGVSITVEQKIDVIILYMYRGEVHKRIAEYVGLGLSTVEKIVSDIRKRGTEYLKSVGYLDASGRPTRQAKDRSEIIDKYGVEKIEARVDVTPIVERTTEEKAKKPVLVKVFGGEKIDIENVSDMSDVQIANRKPITRKDGIRRFLVTAAQDDTPINEAFWQNLLAFGRHMNAEIRVCGTTYQKGLYEDHAIRTATYAPELRPYMQYEREPLTDDVLLLSDANVLPTTANPLAGFETANRGNHVILPSSRVHLKSIARMVGYEPTYAQTTGTVTIPSYTPRAAGQKAVFHHTIGAALVEIDYDGAVFIRQLIADEDGTFYDFDVQAKDGQCTPGHHALSMLWGDTHWERNDARVVLAAFGIDSSTYRVIDRKNSIIDTVHPANQLFNDLNDFAPRNHHTRFDPHERARLLAAGMDDVEESLRNAARFVDLAHRDWCHSYVVVSNHDDALVRWLKDPCGASDAQNAWLWHSLNAKVHKALRDGTDICIVEDAMKAYGMKNVTFLPYGSSLIIGGVECGAHGDYGVNGARGSVAGFRRVAPKMSIGHGHSATILDGCYMAGVSGRFDMGYNERGLTTWSHSHILQYANGKRAIISHVADGRWRAVGRR